MYAAVDFNVPPQNPTAHHLVVGLVLYLDLCTGDEWRDFRTETGCK